MTKTNGDKRLMLFTRRTLLKLSGGILAVAPFVRLPISIHANQPDPIITPARRPFGRAIQAKLAVREGPSVSARLVRRLKWNEVIEIKGQTNGDGPTSYNPIWFWTTDGFVHSAYIQPSENMLNVTLPKVDPNGQWGELTVPASEARSKPDTEAHILHRYYYGCTFRINEGTADSSGAIWYRVNEGNGGANFFVHAEHVRPITPEEFAPLSPEVSLDSKRIVVDLKAQMVTAFEQDKPVFTARVATGAKFRLANGSYRNFGTTPGDHHISLKIAGQRMTGGAAGDQFYYDLPGISWVSYFTSSGIAFHGTYWHNDWGAPRSHGCVNMLPEDAKWIFRWSMPVVSDTTRGFTRPTKRDEGSRVKVF